MVKVSIQVLQRRRQSSDLYSLIEHGVEVMDGMYLFSHEVVVPKLSLF